MFSTHQLLYLVKSAFFSCNWLFTSNSSVQALLLSFDSWKIVSSSFLIFCINIKTFSFSVISSGLAAALMNVAVICCQLLLCLNNPFPGFQRSLYTALLKFFMQPRVYLTSLFRENFSQSYARKQQAKEKVSATIYLVSWQALEKRKSGMQITFDQKEQVRLINRSVIASSFYANILLIYYWSDQCNSLLRGISYDVNSGIDAQNDLTPSQLTRIRISRNCTCMSLLLYQYNPLLLFLLPIFRHRRPILSHYLDTLQQILGSTLKLQKLRIEVSGKIFSFFCFEDLPLWENEYFHTLGHKAFRKNQCHTIPQSIVANHPKLLFQMKFQMGNSKQFFHHFEIRFVFALSARLPFFSSQNLQRWKMKGLKIQVRQKTLTRWSLRMQRIRNPFQLGVALK